MKNLENDINQLHEKNLLKKKIEVHLEGIETKLKNRIIELGELDAKVLASEESIEELEKMNIRTLFATILKNKEQQYEREKQNYLLYFLQRKECLERIEAKEFEIKILKEKLAQLEGVEAAFEKLLNNKKQRLKFKHRELAKDIILIEGNIREKEYMKKEILEAMAKGKEVYHYLLELFTSLKTMESWNPTTNRSHAQESSYYYASYKQKKYTRELLSYVRNVNTSLDDFIDELSDVSKQYDLNYEQFIDRVAHFLKNFYDGLVSDWIFHEELQVTKNLVHETQDKIKRIMAMLEHDFSEADQQIALVREKLKEFIIKNKL